MPYFVFAGKTLFRPGDIHERRILDDIFDLIIVKEGALYIQNGDKKHILEKNDYLLLEPNKLHYGYKPCEEYTTILWLHFSIPNDYQKTTLPTLSSRKIGNHLKYYNKQPFKLYLPTTKCLSEEKFTSIINNMDNLRGVNINHKLRKKDFHAFKISHLAEQQLFFNILATLNVQLLEGATTQDNLAIQTYNYINQNYNESFSLQKLSEELLYSSSYIIQATKKFYNKTPLQIHKEINLKHAKKLLRETNLSISTISEQLGYDTPSYFIKKFKNEFNKTPLQYRNKIDSE